MPEFIIRRGFGVLIEGESEICKITRDGAKLYMQYSKKGDL